MTVDLDEADRRRTTLVVCARVCVAVCVCVGCVCVCAVCACGPVPVYVCGCGCVAVSVCVMSVKRHTDTEKLSRGIQTQREKAKNVDCLD
jgi:hypothetical protein